MAPTALDTSKGTFTASKASSKTKDGRSPTSARSPASVAASPSSVKSPVVVLPDRRIAPMSVPHGSDEDIYKFYKAEDFMAWFDDDALNAARQEDAFRPRDACAAPVKSIKAKQDDQLSLVVELGEDGGIVLVEVLRFDTFRLRWGPGKSSAKEFSSYLSPSLCTNELGELRRRLAQDERVALSAALTHDSTSTSIYNDNSVADDAHVEWSIRANGQETLQIRVYQAHFRVEAWRHVKEIRMPDSDASNPPHTKFARVFSTATQDSAVSALRCKQDAEGNFATLLAARKRGKALGFGEQGGLGLFKDEQLLTYFNYDNMGYSGVYGQQALRASEPMYHSEPFWVEVAAIPGYASSVGYFVDDYCQTFIDVGQHCNAYQIGSRFGDLELHITCADDVASVSHAHASCTGRGRLWPKYVLGYHQGCYGYDTREKVINAAMKHRQYNIPLDGLHIDVDLQRKYRTFTMDQGQGGRFQDPKGMFQQLQNMGVKCSTNITPVISSTDDAKRDYWQEGSAARSQYATLDDGLKKGVFVKERRYNAGDDRTPEYICWEGGNERRTRAQYIENWQTDTEYRGGVSYGKDLGTNGVYPDLGRKEVRDWWGAQYKELIEAGLSFVWQDMTTPAVRVESGDMKGFPFRLLLSDDSSARQSKRGHLQPALKVWNSYSFNLHKATYKGLQRLRPDERPFIIGRGSFTGMHRFAALWTGDNASTWNFLRIMIQQVLSAGIGGITFTGADTGGFEREGFTGSWADPQLVIRWTVAASLLPWLRNHYMGKPGTKLFQEPYAYYEHASQMGDQAPLYRAVLPICRYYIHLRYTLVQALYDLHFNSLFDGLPIARSMCATDPWDEALFGERQKFLGEQYMVGHALLVCPVLYSTSETALSSQIKQGIEDLYLPCGSHWYDFNLHLRSTGDDVATQQLSPAWTALKARRAGGRVLKWTSSVDRYALGDVGHLPYLLPIFVREGSVFPTRKNEQWVGQLDANPVTLHAYPLRAGRSASHSLFLDDGRSVASAPKELPQYAHDELARRFAQSKYRHLRLEQSASVINGEYTRTITLELKHDGWALEEVVKHVGAMHTLQLWHDPRHAAIAASARVACSDPAAQITYDAAMASHVVSFAVDGTRKRSFTIVFAKGSPTL
ncbi:glycoside hydrolase family 31 protein [Ceraceosorus bombacis]|uniref:Glycoside hydrolase family 31 protein n=1 Tax=Ceraceosorus bombacis TaxID=401625 RepID=A0A0P1BCT9_9BASI|nr:glycoside hydrolase family 31 protein [Ceraceosorus bombacis]